MFFSLVWTLGGILQLNRWHSVKATCKWLLWNSSLWDAETRRCYKGDNSCSFEKVSTAGKQSSDKGIVFCTESSNYFFHQGESCVELQKYEKSRIQFTISFYVIVFLILTKHKYFHCLLSTLYTFLINFYISWDALSLCTDIPVMWIMSMLACYVQTCLCLCEVKPNIGGL